MSWILPIYCGPNKLKDQRTITLCSMQWNDDTKSIRVVPWSHTHIFMVNAPPLCHFSVPIVFPIMLPISTTIMWNVHLFPNNFYQFMRVICMKWLKCLDCFVHFFCVLTSILFSNNHHYPLSNCYNETKNCGHIWHLRDQTHLRHPSCVSVNISK